MQLGVLAAEVTALGPAGSGETRHTWLLAQQGRGTWGWGRETFVLTAFTLWVEIVRLRAAWEQVKRSPRAVDLQYFKQYRETERRK